MPDHTLVLWLRGPFHPLFCIHQRSSNLFNCFSGLFLCMRTRASSTLLQILAINACQPWPCEGFIWLVIYRTALDNRWIFVELYLMLTDTCSGVRSPFLGSLLVLASRPLPALTQNRLWVAPTSLTAHWPVVQYQDLHSPALLSPCRCLQRHGTISGFETVLGLQALITIIHNSRHIKVTDAW